MAFLLMQALRAQVVGQKMKAATVLLLKGFVCTPGQQLIMLKLLTIYPGSLAINGLTAWALALTLMLVPALLASKVLARLWPIRLPDDQTLAL